MVSNISQNYEMDIIKNSSITTNSGNSYLNNHLNKHLSDLLISNVYIKIFEDVYFFNISYKDYSNIILSICELNVFNIIGKAEEYYNELKNSNVFIPYEIKQIIENKLYGKNNFIINKNINLQETYYVLTYTNKTSIYVTNHVNFEFLDVNILGEKFNVCLEKSTVKFILKFLDKFNFFAKLSLAKEFYEEFKINCSFFYMIPYYLNDIIVKMLQKYELNLKINKIISDE